MISKIDLCDGCPPDQQDAYRRKMQMRDLLFEEREPLPVQREMLSRLGRHSYQDLVAASMRRHLSFEEAFAAMCFALRATNASLTDRFFGALPSFGASGDLMAAREMLSGLAMKEAWVHLDPAEIAGMVAATMLDVMRLPNYGSRVLENCGMGGDRGVQFNGEPKPRKTINCSTLAALVLASLDVKVAKHGSYGNTSLVGSTNAVERLGIVVDVASVEHQQHLADGNFHYTCAHAWKTVHDLSHLLPRRETVNHIVGPMTPPVSPDTRLDKVIGVNDKLHPEIVARAWQILHERGVFTVGNVAVVAGLSELLETGEADVHHRLREHIILDELSPVASAVAFVRGGVFLGTHVLAPSDFGARFNNVRASFVPSEPEAIYAANMDAVRGVVDEREFVQLLAMNAALALYLVECMDDDEELSSTHGPSRDALQQCYHRCMSALTEGRVRAYLDRYVRENR